MRLHDGFAICYSDFCKLYPRGMLSFSVWWKLGVRDAAREDRSGARWAPSLPVVRLQVMGSKIKVYGSCLPLILLAPIYLILLFSPYLSLPSQFTRRSKLAG